MKIIKEKGFTVNVCTDILEWAKEFYGMPDGAELENKSEVETECMGFSQIDEKIIWIFVPEQYVPYEVKKTIAHEVGHIIELTHPNNPEQTEENHDAHEAKAQHYEDFFMLVERISETVIWGVLQSFDSNRTKKERFCKTIFPVRQDDGSHKFRAYFKDLDTNFVFNPLPHPLFETQNQALFHLKKEIRSYLDEQKE